METCIKCGKEVENYFVDNPTKDEKDEEYKCLACYMKDHWTFKGASVNPVES
jgi:hypothetical protein